MWGSSLSYTEGGPIGVGLGIMDGERTSCLPTSHYFFQEWIWGPHLHPGAQRTEKLSKALSLMCVTAGDASYLLQMQAKNTEE